MPGVTRTAKKRRPVLTAVLLIILTIKWWQVMPAVIFVSYLCYGPARPWISRRLRRELEEEDEERELEEALEKAAEQSIQESPAVEEAPAASPDVTPEDRDRARRLA